ncbi:MAG TPA: hypothetical protein VID76_00785 [Solirubrobacterales bacterium]
MLSIYACTLLIAGASLVVGRAILALLGQRRPAWLSAATGFAALVVAAPLLLRLPGRATTAAVLLGIAVIAAAAIALRDVRRSGDAHLWPLGVAAVAIVLAAGTLPFLISDRVGVLGEGVYTNDHAAQLYWADWLQHGFGPEPSAVRFGYPIGPQAVAVIAAQITGASLIGAFNGLLLAIPALTALTALAGLGGMPPGRRIAIAALSGLPYLAASFFAQSAFKETAMALFVLAFALALQSRSAAEDEARPPPWRSVVAIGLLMAAASVFTFSAPGLAWFAIAIPIWLLLEARGGRSPVNWGAVRDSLAAHKVTLVVAVVIVLGIAAVAFTPAREFASKIADVQDSAGRLSSPVFPGEAFGIWPAGDFRVVRGEVSGSLLAVALGAVAAGFGALTLWRRRQFALLAMLVTGAVVYLGTRRFAEIHVQAKALMVIAPLVLLVGLRALLAPPRNLVRYAFGVLVFAAAAGSTLLALRDAPVGFDDRQLGLERLAERADGESVAFLGVDRFAGYYLRGTLARAPAGYVPEEIASRPDKRWQQGLSADFDSLESGQLDRFKYAITTKAAFQSTAPSNFEPVLQSGDYVLWARSGETPRAKILPAEGTEGAVAVFNPGASFDCAGGGPKRKGEAVVTPEPARAAYTAWRQPPPPDASVAGQDRGWQAPGSAAIALDLPTAGDYALSLQYHSQVPLTVSVDGEQVAELPASLDGMYLSGAGRGAFWPAGEVAQATAGEHEVTVEAAEPGGLAGTLNARRLVWLGDLAASPVADPETLALAAACGRYVDHYAYEKNGGGG